ncbi:hypothetical protein N7527_000112 [Penicillium freii]|nr:hypothetical protein N7527_000112 [Penicillium freii]
MACQIKHVSERAGPSTNQSTLRALHSVDKCLQILAGVVESQTTNAFKCAFPGRRSSGKWVLEYAPKGFDGAHGGRHL